MPSASHSLPPVYTTGERDIEIALGLDNIDKETSLPAGLMTTGNNISVPIIYNGDFLVGDMDIGI